MDDHIAIIHHDPAVSRRPFVGEGQLLKSLFYI